MHSEEVQSTTVWTMLDHHYITRMNFRMYQCKIKAYDDVLRFVVLEEDGFVGVNKGPWGGPAWFIFDLFCSSAGVFSLSDGKAEGPEDP